MDLKNLIFECDLQKCSDLKTPTDPHWDILYLSVYCICGSSEGFLKKTFANIRNKC